MRKLVALASVAVLTLALAVPGLAAKPDKTPAGPERNGRTCADSPFRSDMTDFNKTLNGSEELTHTFLMHTFLPGEPSLCIDLLNLAQATMTITVTDSENAYGVGSNVKDSYPGDVCALFDMIDLGDATTGSTELSIPEAELDACGTGWTDDAASLVSSVVGAFKGKYDKPGSGAYIDVTISLDTGSGE